MSDVQKFISVENHRNKSAPKGGQTLKIHPHSPRATDCLELKLDESDIKQFTNTHDQPYNKEI